MQRCRLLESTAGVLFGTITIGACTAYAGPVNINGGGTHDNYEYLGYPLGTTAEETLFNSIQTSGNFTRFWSVPTTVGETGFLNNDLTCLSNYDTTGGGCLGAQGGSNTVHYFDQDTPLSSDQIHQWSTSAYGQSLSGDLIQIPTVGMATAIAVVNTAITANGKLMLSDSDLCEIFSGGFTDFSQITDSATAPAAGTIQLLYRSDPAETTFILTTHLAAVCSQSNTQPGITFTPTTVFASIFPYQSCNNGQCVVTEGLTNGANNGFGYSSLIANAMAGAGTEQIANSIGYVTPDFTSIDSATANAKLANSQPSPLIVVGLRGGSSGKGYTPTNANITLGLSRAVQGFNLNPPSTAAGGANPTNWVPIIQKVASGYPLIGYQSVILAQCYAQDGASVLSYLSDHYTNASFEAVDANNGLVPVPKTHLTAIEKNILANSNGWNTNLQNPTNCAGRIGR